MIISNYHSHFKLDDGNGELHDYAEYALSQGMNIIGTSPHAPVYYENDWTMTEDGLSQYLQEVKALKKEYKERLEIYTGLEIDYLGKNGGPNDDKWNIPELDYKIGSVHSMLDPVTNSELAVDGPVEELEMLLKNRFNGNIKELVKKYFQIEEEMIAKGGFDILGHCDLIKKRNMNNRFFDENESWYKKLAAEMLDTLKGSDLIVEVNTGGISRKATKDVYPSPWMLKRCLEMNIPLTLSSDAHKPQNLNFYFKESIELLKSTGYREIYFFSNGIWHSQPI
ncbi:MAG: histidinol-phosphatase [Spirochaetales bacterium]|nr:histidinol-phosphatase [Spirochaetales bacterium]